MSIQTIVVIGALTLSAGSAAAHSELQSYDETLNRSLSISALLATIPETSTPVATSGLFNNPQRRLFDTVLALAKKPDPQIPQLAALLNEESGACETCIDAQTPEPEELRSDHDMHSLIALSLD